MVDVYGFGHEDLEAARKAVEEVLSILLEKFPEQNPSVGFYFRSSVESAPYVQIRSNSGPHQRGQWHSAYGILVFVHGTGRESTVQRLCSVPGLRFLESKATMDDYNPLQG